MANTTLANGFYGNDSETYFVNPAGRMFCVQSPDLAAFNDEPQPVNELPPNVEPVSDELCVDLDIPNWVRNAVE